MSKSFYENESDALQEAKESLKLAQKNAEWIYLQRQMEPDLSKRIHAFYYSLYYCIIGILSLKTKEKFKKHESAINAFNYYIYNNDYLNTDYVSAVAVLKGLREEYEYHNADVDADQYQMAEQLWKKYFPELENELILLIQKKEAVVESSI